jgi:hypothetical protein
MQPSGLLMAQKGSVTPHHLVRTVQNRKENETTRLKRAASCG